MNIFQRMWVEDDGILTFEWILLMSLVVVGIVGGIAGVRDAIIDELGDVAQAVLALDQSYVIQPPLVVIIHNDLASGTASNSLFVDGVENFNDDLRVGINGQKGLLDLDI